MAIIGANGVVYDEFGNVTGGVDDVIASTVTPKSFTQLLKEAQTKAGVKAPVKKTPQGKVYEPDKPKVTNLGDTALIGAPTVSNLARGIVDNTGIAISNKNIVHVCDTTLYIRRNVDLGKIATMVTKTIRDAIQQLMEFLGISPGSSSLVESLKWIKRKIEDITEFLNDVQAAINTFVIVVREIRDVIAYILSLPAQLVSYFAKCLAEATKELAKQFGDIFNQSGGGVGLDDIVDETKSLIKSTETLVATTVATAGFAATALPSALFGSSSVEEANKAQELLGGDGKAEVDKLVGEAYSSFNNTTTYEKA
jgi:hypothetical protein